jgi:hypothetical protein
VSLSQACFGNNVYDYSPTIQCFSNLLSTGFRRIILDIYWDYTQKSWSPCPVMLSNATSTSPSVQASSTTSTQSSATGPGKRQAPISTSSVPPNASPTLSVNAGPYSCEPNLTFPVLLRVLTDYMSTTATNLGAMMIYLDLNLHTATPPDGALTNLTPSQAPGMDQTIGTLINVNDSSILYTPLMLQQQRQNLDASWLSNKPTGTADAFYLATMKNQSTVVSPSGWPNEGYVEFSQRLLVSIGDIDSELNYNITADSNTIFKSSDILNVDKVTLSASGEVNQGCFFQADQMNLTNNNNSWALTDNLDISSLSTTELAFLPSISNLTACGVSPLLNSTLLNLTADAQIIPYQSVVFSSIWSWSFGEPRTIPTNATNSKLLRCAVMDASLSGRWRIADCSERHYGACVSTNQPFSWKMSAAQGSYSSHDQDCPSGTKYSVPRTGIENSHLFSAMKASDDAMSDGSIWLNFNSLNQPSCWVSKPFFFELCPKRTPYW